MVAWVRSDSVRTKTARRSPIRKIGGPGRFTSSVNQWKIFVNVLETLLKYPFDFVVATTFLAVLTALVVEVCDVGAEGATTGAAVVGVTTGFAVLVAVGVVAANDVGGTTTG